MTLWLGTESSEAKERQSGIWRVLRAGHFSGAMNEDAHVKPIAGSITANGARYHFMEFSWEETPKNMMGGFPHGQNRLLVFEQTSSGLSYLGSYEVAGGDFRGPVHPEIRGKTVFFPYHDIEIMGVKQSLTISFEKGPPPISGPGGVNRFFR